MPSRLSLCVYLAVTVLLSSCSPPPPVILAAMESGELVFHLRHTGAILLGKPFGYDDHNETVQHLRVTGPNDEIKWQLGAENTHATCEDQPDFPVTYGAARCSVRTVTPASELQNGEIYRVILPDGASTEEEAFPYAYGEFRLSGGSVINLRP